MNGIRLCRADEITDPGSRGFVFNGLNLLAVNINGCLRLYLNRCPHAGIPLEWVADAFLDDSRTLIQCANHGALFLPESGLCVAGPCAGQSLQPYPFDLIDGHITLTA